MVRITRDNNGTKELLWNYGRMVECKNKKEAIELLRSKGITDLTGIEFPVVKKLRDSRFTLFVKKWARIYLKADMSEWSDVINAFEDEYQSRAKKDEKFRKDYESSDMLLSTHLMDWVKILGNIKK